jgi:hypothetical protein
MEALLFFLLFSCAVLLYLHLPFTFVFFLSKVLEADLLGVPKGKT